MLYVLVASFLAGTAPQSCGANEEKPSVMVSLTQLDNEIQALRETLSQTIAALDEVKVAANKNADLSIPFGTFSKASQWSVA